jgi:hypothetical protein
MRKVWVLVPIVLALVTPASTALAAEAPPPTQTTVPATLQALEQKMGELKITSMRFSAQTSITVPRRERELRRLLQLLGGGSTQISGEETLSPPAGNVTITLLGHPLTLRVVGKTVYSYLPALARVDHGRPWVRLGNAGLEELFTVNGKHVFEPAKTTEPQIGEPSLAEPPFVGLQKELAGAREVRELGVGTLYGQPVTSFLAVLEPEQLKGKLLASASRRLPSRQPPTATLEVSLTQNGLPLRTVITEHDAGVTTSVTLDIPAINFPLAIEAPPAAQTIGVARLRVLERRERRRHSKHKP